MKNISWGLFWGVMFFSLSIAQQIQLPISAGDDDWEILQLKKYDRSQDSDTAETPNYYVETIALPGRDEIPFTLEIFNGDSDSRQNRIAGATIKVNGEVICTPSDFEKDFDKLEKEIRCKGICKIEIFLEGKRGSFLRLHCIKHLRAISPFVDSIAVNTNETFTAYFGYQNENSFEVPVPIGRLNHFDPPPFDRGQPEIFKPGEHHNVFSILFDGTPLTWEIRRRTATAVRPLLIVTAPIDGFITSSSSVHVEGSVAEQQGKQNIAVTVNKVKVPLHQGQFDIDMPLQAGLNNIIVQARDHDAIAMTVIRKVIMNAQPLGVTINTPAENIITNQTSLTVNGTVSSPDAAIGNVTMTINGSSADIQPDGSFQLVVPLAEGLNTITCIAADAAGRSSSAIRTVRLDTKPPVCTIQSPVDSLITNLPSITVSGTVSDSTSVTMTINSQSVPIQNNSFTSAISLNDGTNKIVIAATDAAGNTAALTRIVISDRTPPALVVLSPLNFAVTNLSSVVVSGIVKDSSSLTLTINGASHTVNSDGNFIDTVSLSEGLNTITTAAADAAGNSSSIIRTIRRDTQPPVLALSSPVDSLITNLSTITISGTLTDSTSVLFTVNGDTVSVLNNSFTGQMNLVEGMNTIILVATDAAGNRTSKNLHIRKDSQAPFLTILGPADSLVTKTNSLAITGTVSDSTKIDLTVNNNPVAVHNDGSFSDTLQFNEGMNLLQISATDGAGNAASLVRHVRLDTQPPVITILTPSDSLITKNTKVIMTGSVIDSTSVTFTLNGIAYALNPGGSFADTISLNEGINEVALTAEDRAGNKSTIKRYITRDTKPPVINLIAPLAGSMTIDSLIPLMGSVNDVSGITVTINGLAQRTDQSGSFKSAMLLNQGINPISIYAVDQAGNTSVLTNSVTRVLPVPDPAVIAPKLDTTIITNTGDATEFLYTGSNPIQKGVAHGTIKKLQVCVVRGHVFDKNKNPIKGVNISVLNHSEFGSTLSRDDGMYDLAVNGGSYLTINYDRNGYLSAQRKVDTRYQLYSRAEDVMLLSMDTSAHHTDLSVPQIVQGSQVADSLGSRRPSLFIRPGTTANLVFNKYYYRTLTGCSQAPTNWCPNTITVPTVLVPLISDSLLPVSSITLRMTEYTASGAHAIPAMLPAGVALSFAFELCADEMISSGAKDVRFTQPAVFYLENIMNFPVGLTVPFGWYDRQNGVWCTSANGKVLKIVDTIGGTASIDYNGDNIAEPLDTLVSYGISVIEQQYIAKNFMIGQSLWRCEITHLGTFAAGFTMIGPSNAQEPHNALPDRYIKIEKDNVSAGSVIGLQDQTLAESIPVTNTGLSLNYKSDRVFGRREAYTLDIPVTGSVVPSGASNISLDIEIVGRKFSFTFPIQPNLTYHFVWDGMDAYGRRVQGQQNILTTITYSYPAQYALPPDYKSCFAVPSGQQIVKYIPTLNSMQKTQIWEGKIGAFDIVSLGIGGWSLNIHHGYDCVGRILYQGNGSVRNAQLMDNIASTVAGRSGSINNWCPDGGLNGTTASQNITGASSSLCFNNLNELHYYGAPGGGEGGSMIYKIDTSGITRILAGLLAADGGDTSTTKCINCSGFGTCALAFGPDNCLYASEWAKGVIWKISPYGERIRYAGIIGANTYAGDGGPAIQASFYNPSSIAFDKDGNLYVFEGGNHRIRKISPDGIVTTVAGTGVEGTSGDGGPAIKAMIYGGLRPMGNGVGDNGITDMKVGPDGTIYFGDGNANHIRKITPDGIIHTIAGNGENLNTGDGGPAVYARVGYPYSLTLGKDGTIYFASNAARVRGISTDGYIKTIYGGGSLTTVENCPATSANIGCYPNVEMGPDNNLYVLDKAWPNGPSYTRIVKVAPPLPGISMSEILVASEDGSEQYVFSYGGRHLRTLDALTGVVKYKFNYDSLYHLISIIDIDSNRTTIARDANGNATAIISPYGVRTDLQLDTLGYLLQATNPAYESNIFTYTTGGLMTSKTDARGNTYNYSYDTLGYLTKDMDPAGGYTNLSRQYDSVGYTVTSLTAMGKKMTYRVDKLHDGSRVLTNTDANGLKTITTIGTDGTSKTATPDGMNAPDQQTPDPRFGMQAPLQNITVNTPGGLQSNVNQTRTVTQMTGNSVTGLTDNVQVNGKTYTTQWEGNLRMLTKTSAEGRKTFSFYDAKGRDIKDSTAGLAPTTYKYDTRGRKIQTSQGSRITTYAYDSLGRQAKVTDPYGHNMQFSYDAGDRLVQITATDSSQVLFKYDKNGNVTAITPPGKPEHVFDYSKVDLETLYTPPFAGDSARATAHIYTLDKEVLKVLKPDSLNISIEYGGRGSLAGQPKKIYFDRGIITNLFDTTKALQVGVVSPNGDSLKYQYDGTMLRKATWTGPNGVNSVKGSVAFSYNSDMQVSTETVLPAIGNTDSVNMKYDKDGLLTSVGVMKLRYGSGNALLMSDTVGNIITNYSYDTYGMPASKEIKTGTTTLYRIDFVRDSLSRIIQKTDNEQGVIAKYNYSYDPVGRLIHVTKNDTLISTYSYDANGNRLTHIAQTRVDSGYYDAQDRLLIYSSTKYFYTQNGDLRMKVDTVTGDTTRYVYDAFGSLVSIKLRDGTLIEYLIDGSGHRIGRKVNGVITQKWIYSSDLRIIAELDSANNITSRFVYTSGENVPEYMVLNGVIYKIITDHLGSVRQIANAQTGAVIQQMDYDEYGNVLVDSNPGFTPFGFAGGLYDQQTKLVRFGARDYDVYIGRWSVKDQIGFSSKTSNFFSYCSLDPINKIDFDGNDAKGAFVEIIQAIISLGAADLGSAGIHASASFIQAITTSDETHFDRWGNLAKNSDNTKLVDKRGFDLIRGFSEGFASGIIPEGAEIPVNDRPLNKSGALYLLGYSIGSWLGMLAAP